jgi:hypothetical protein
VLGGQEVKQRSGTKDYYNPYTDGSAAGVTPYDKTLVKAFVENEETGAGATLDYDLLDTRGNSQQLEATAINYVNGSVNVPVNKTYNLAGQQVSANYRGFVISGGKKIIK